MGSEAAEFLRQLEEYYSPSSRPSEKLAYTKVKAGTILAALGNLPKEYLVELYRGVINLHSGQYKTLPDLAVIRKVQNGMDRPETYRRPAPQIEDMTTSVYSNVTEQLAAREKEEGEINHEERQRVRAKIMRRDATKYESWWIHCIDENNGVYTPMPRGWDD